MKSLPQEATMKPPLRLLSCSLVAATIGTSAFGGPDEGVRIGSKAGEGVGQESPMILAGANGHDSVGGLMPLPLWPSIVPGRGKAFAPVNTQFHVSGEPHRRPKSIASHEIRLPPAAPRR
jgi:hypothetical protein